MVRFSIDTATTKDEIKSTVIAVKRAVEALSGVLSQS
jgi:cysteine sulfinate desulfinase/cysteine desulfurase-like protein